MTTTENEQQILAVLDARADAIQNKELNGVAHDFTPDAQVFRLAPPWIAQGGMEKYPEAVHLNKSVPFLMDGLFGRATDLEP